MRRIPLLCCLCTFLVLPGFRAAAAPDQFILFNAQPQFLPAIFDDLRTQFTNSPNARIQVGVSTIFSYLHQPRDKVVQQLSAFLAKAQATATPIVVQFDGENWWGQRPDLWNWWDPKRPGYSPTNRLNVEWTSWSPEDAIKIAWRNWGSQLRVLPPPNLMSAPYRAACHAEMRVLVPLVLAWWKQLPADQKHLLVGIKLGHESSIGVNAWYYPNGNALVDSPASGDPRTGLKAQEIPARGVTQIGYAAVKTAGLRSSGTITEADLAEVVRRHLEDLSRLAAELGVPRDKLFTHVAGWKDNELLYETGLNPFSCPGWSFYKYAGDPARDAGVQQALRKNDAPYWGAVEWLFQGPRETTRWREALQNTLADPRCRYLSIYNYEPVRHIEPAMQAIHQTIAAGPKR